MLRHVLAMALMRTARNLLDDSRDTATVKLCDAAATEDLELAGVHSAYNLADTQTRAWIFPAFSAILGQEC